MRDDIGTDANRQQDDDAAYFARRAEWHRQRASVAPDDSTCALHEKFANLYQARAHG